MSFSKTQINLEIIIVCEVSQKNKYHIVPLIGEMEKIHTNELTYNRQIVLENKHGSPKRIMCKRGELGGWD